MATSEAGQGLQQRAVGLPTAISATFGLILATTVIVSVPQLFLASTVGLVALIVGLVMMYLQAMSFSELATMIPKAGSMNEYVRAGLGPFFATVTVFVGYFAIVIFPGSAEAFLPARILSSEAFLDLGLTFKWWVAIIVIAIAILNLLGIRAFAAVEVPLTFILAGSLLIFGLAGLAGIGDTIGPALPSIDFDFDLLIALIALATFTFVGVEYTCPLAEELRQPERDLPWGMFIGLTLVAVPMFVWGIASTRYDPGDLAEPTNMFIAIGIFGDFGKWWMGILSVAATLSTLNAVAAGVPRIIYGMSQTRQLPKVLGWLTPTTRAPAVGIVLVSIPPIWLNVTDQTLEGGFLELILAGVLGWGLAYAIIHVTQIILRVRYPSARRPYRSPWFPIPQVLGIALLAIGAWGINRLDILIELSPGNIYRNFGWLLLVGIVFSLIYNGVTYGAAKMFRPVPLDEVYRETEVIAHEVPEEHFHA